MCVFVLTLFRFCLASGAAVGDKTLLNWLLKPAILVAINILKSLWIVDWWCQIVILVGTNKRCTCLCRCKRGHILSDLSKLLCAATCQPHTSLTKPCKLYRRRLFWHLRVKEKWTTPSRDHGWRAVKSQVGAAHWIGCSCVYSADCSYLVHVAD
jgi:hypothetical protein